MYSVYSIVVFLLFALPFIFGIHSEEDLRSVQFFKEAKPVWPQDRETEKNLSVSYRVVCDLGDVKNAVIKIAASTNYRAYINGKFLSHGPCVAAHDYFRIDAYQIDILLKQGKNIISIEVCGYNHNSYYLIDQPSFLQAEVIVNGKVIAASGSDKDFSAYILNQRKQDVPLFSFQRPYTEYYNISPGYDDWMKNAMWSAQKPEICKIQPAKKLLQRGVPYPDYTISKAIGKVSEHIYMFDKNTTGFIGFSVKVKKPSKLVFYFDEILSKGDVDVKRLTCNSFLTYDLQPGEYELESMEPYTLKYLKPEVMEGECELNNLYIRNYVNSDVHRAKFFTDNTKLNFLFEAARETYRQSSLDVFMDNPSRERAGWLCDSYFSARVAFDMSGNTLLERNFFENFLLPDTFKYLPKGMLPMCYPSDHNNGNFIPNWAMWFVIQMEEYVQRSGDKEMIRKLKPKVYDLIRYFIPFKNEDGLLEKLDKWIFIEWSAANQFVQDVNYPTNMLYAKMLDVAGRLYDDLALKEEAEQIREVIQKQSFDGKFFCDNAIRKDGKLEVQPNQTEVCQYYAFYFNLVTPESHPALWQCLLKEFGPVRKTNNKYPSVHVANAFIGNYLRLELLAEHHLIRQMMEESLDEYLIMAETTGTLWENMTSVASCNQGFASHIAHVFYRDILGIHQILPARKEIKIRFNDVDLTKCEGSIPIGDDYVRMQWEKKDGWLYYSLSKPKGYRVEIENFSNQRIKEVLYTEN